MRNIRQSVKCVMIAVAFGLMSGIASQALALIPTHGTRPNIFPIGPV
jgi:hypothetical protein